MTEGVLWQFCILVAGVMDGSENGSRCKEAVCHETLNSCSEGGDCFSHAILLGKDRGGGLYSQGHVYCAPCWSIGKIIDNKKSRIVYGPSSLRLLCNEIPRDPKHF